MSRFQVGDIVYPLFYPEEDTKCTVIEIDGKCSCGCNLKVLVTKSEDGRIIDEIEECFLKEGESLKDILGPAIYIAPSKNCPLTIDQQTNCVTCSESETCLVKRESII